MKKTQNAQHRQHRQGDVFLSPSRIPAAAKPIPIVDRLILAYGEVTGHTHRIEDLEGVEAYETEDGRIMIRLSKEAALRHEEHLHPRLIQPGEYEVIQQCEEIEIGRAHV